MPNRDYYMRLASEVASASKDSTKVGAILVGQSGEIRLTGYNGPPIGVEDTPARFIAPEKYLYASHAEQNVIAFAAREGIRTSGCKMYTTHFPCSTCARLIIQAGIKHVIAGPGTFKAADTEVPASKAMFDEAGVTYVCETAF